MSHHPNPNADRWFLGTAVIAVAIVATTGALLATPPGEDGAFQVPAMAPATTVRTFLAGLRQSRSGGQRSTSDEATLLNHLLQAKFTVLQPKTLPRIPVLKQARVVAGETGEPKEVAWLVYEGPIVCIEAGDASGVLVWLESLELPPSWKRSVTRVGKTAILVTAPGRTEAELDRISTSAEPIPRR